ncbi:MAG: hypothetical protein HYS13_21235 [Planctomycetia bacterium]|nr:hypothetical protein [Planctomycetia bacterium]
MSIAVRCRVCGQQFAVEGQAAGTAARCPACGTSNEVPAGAGTFDAQTFGAGTLDPAPAQPPAFNPYQAPATGDAPVRVLPPGVRPHRGGTVMAMGIVSCSVAAIGAIICSLLLLVSLPLGIVSWIMARNDLREMAAGTMDVSGRGQTMTGMITGIIATALSALVLFVMLAIFVLYAVIIAASAAR